MSNRRITVDRDPRQRWAWNVRINGKVIARCDSEGESAQIVDALDLADYLASIQSPDGAYMRKLQSEASEVFRNRPIVIRTPL